MAKPAAKRQLGTEIGGAPASAWVLLLVLTLAYTSSYADRQIFVLALDAVRHQLSISDTEVSVLAGTAFSLTYACAAVPIAWVSDRISRKVVLIAAILLWSAATATCGVASTYSQMFAARMAVGLGEAALGPAAYAMIAAAFPAKHRNAAFTIYVLGAVIGSGVGFAYGGGLMSVAGVSGSAGVDHAALARVFFYVSLTGLPIALALLVLREIRPSDTARTSVGPSLGHAFGERGTTYLSLFFATAMLEAAAVATLTWSPTIFARQYNIPPAHFAVTLGQIILLVGPAAMVVGASFSRLIRRGRSVAEANLLTAAVATIGLTLCALFMFAVTGSSAELLLVGAVVFFALLPVALIPSALQELTADELRARVSSIYLLANNLIGGVVGASAVAILSDKLFDGPSRLMVALAITIALVSSLATVAFLVSARNCRIGPAA